MKVSVGPLVVLATALLYGQQSVLAQYGEMCHYECAIVYCDPYTDYCDYDCYEVCYPYRAASTGSTTTAPTQQFASGKFFDSPASMKGASSARHTHADHHRSHPEPHLHPQSHERFAAAAAAAALPVTGKPIRMKIQKAAVPLALRTRDASKSDKHHYHFALFQGCLSEPKRD